MAESERGHCRSCGAELVDWKRVHRRDVDDATFVFKSLKNELTECVNDLRQLDIRI